MSVGENIHPQTHFAIVNPKTEMDKQTFTDILHKTKMLSKEMELSYRIMKSELW